MGNTENTALGSEKITVLIRKFALPAILSNLVGSSYNIVDQIFVGQKLGTVGNAATNIAFPLVLLMVTFYVTIGCGATSKFSLYQGAGKKEKAGKVVGNGLMTLAVVGIALMSFTLLFLSPLMKLFGAKGQTLNFCNRHSFSNIWCGKQYAYQSRWKPQICNCKFSGRSCSKYHS